MTDKRYFDTFDQLRLPLALAVVFIHMGPKCVVPGESGLALLSSEGLVNLLYFCSSKLWFPLSVPGFFLISGYLMFVGLEQWDGACYLKKLKRRIWSLLIPYILWNVLSILVDGDLQLLWNPHAYFDIIAWGQDVTNWWGAGLGSSGPHNLPLWFVRNMMVAVLLTPVAGFFLRRAPFCSLGVLLLLLLTQSIPYNPFVNADSLFYFFLGGCMALHRWPFLEWIERHRLIIYALCLLLMMALLFLSGIPGFLYGVLNGLFCLFGVASLLAVAYRYPVPTIRKLSIYCMLIYAGHTLIIGPVGDGVHCSLQRLGLVGFYCDVPTYLLTPLIVVALWLAVGWLLQRYTPVLWRLSVGK